MCKHASLRPALHVQWEQTIVPHFSAGMFSGEADTDCECLTRLSFHHPGTLLHRMRINNYTVVIQTLVSF